MTLTQRQQEIKDEFIKVRGAWSDAWEDILRLDPEFLASYLKFSAVPWRKNHLDDKLKEFIYLAVDANATHMYLPGVRQHIAAALRLGATPQEIMEVLELSATLGIHAMNIGVPILVEVLEEKGLRSGPAPLTEYQEEVKARFTATRGYWHSFWDEMLELDPELFAAYTEFSSHPWHHGTLEPKVKEFIYIAFDTAATHLYVKGLKLHIENAVGYGATAQEILEVMEIASVLGIHAVTSAAPILAELARDAWPAEDDLYVPPGNSRGQCAGIRALEFRIRTGSPDSLAGGISKMASIVRNVRNSLVGEILAAASILAVGCGSPGSGAAGQASGPDPVAPSSASAVSAAPCPTSNLRISLGDGGAAAGTDFTVLDFTNSGTISCTLYGFPGVSLLNSSGRQIGAAATRNPAKASAKITLAPGAEASASLGVANAENYPKAACEPTPAAKLRVFPPNQAQAVEVPFTTTGCGVPSTRQLNVTAVSAGAGRAVQG